jgi:uncharacterized protein YbjT (DUF2867 family)
VARALIVGCGCRGRELGAQLIGAGWAVRGTSRSPEGLAAIEAAGIGAAAADPSRPGSVLELIGDVAVVFWLLGSARGEPDAVEALHGEALEHLLRRLVDTPVRGFAYEAGGTVPPSAVARGEQLLDGAAATWRMRTATISADPEDRAAWLDQAVGAATTVLATGD